MVKQSKKKLYNKLPAIQSNVSHKSLLPFSFFPFFRIQFYNVHITTPNSKPHNNVTFTLKCCEKKIVRDSIEATKKVKFLPVHRAVNACKERKYTYSHTHSRNYLLTPWCRVLLEKLTGLQLVKKFPAFHGNRRFISALTSVHHLSLSWASPIQSIYPHPTSWRSILILSIHLRLGLPTGLFPSGFPKKSLYTPLSSPIRATCPAHLILLDFINRKILGEEYKSFSSSLCNLLHSPVTFLVPNILLNTIFSNTLSFLSSLNVSDHIST